MGKEKKLVAMMRVKDGEKFIGKALASIHDVVEKIVILDDKSTDSTVNIASQFSKVKIIKTPYSDFNEARDKNLLIVETKRENPDWILSIDHDEVYEAKFASRIKELMNPVNPETMCYIFPFFHMWNKEDCWRGDGLWGFFLQGRLFKNLPNQYLPVSEDGLHCGSTPWFSFHNTNLALIKVKHYGNMYPEDRKRKYEFYTRTDKHKDPLSILGGNVEYYKKLYGKEVLEDSDYYRHLIDEKGLYLRKWCEDSSITLNMMTGGTSSKEDAMRAILSVQGIVDEVVVVDTGSKDDTAEKLRAMGAKVIQVKWEHNFSKPRNICIENSSHNWIFRLDPDEILRSSDLIKAWYMSTDDNIDAYVLPIKNYKYEKNPDGTNPWVLSQTMRFHKNREYIRYKNMVHEDIDSNVLMKMGKKVGESPCSLDHYGLMFPKQELAVKHEYYYRLNLEMIKQEPNNFFPYYNAGIHLRDNGKVDEAIGYLLKSVALNEKSFLSWSGLATCYEEKGLLDKAMSCYKRASRIDNVLVQKHYVPGILNAIEKLKKKMADKKEKKGSFGGIFNRLMNKGSR